MLPKLHTGQVGSTEVLSGGLNQQMHDPAQIGEVAAEAFRKTGMRGSDGE
jgi:hypothetical protein